MQFHSQITQNRRVKSSILSHPKVLTSSMKLLIAAYMLRVETERI